ncbi:hypothetical protein [Kitasatospora griseola]|uniref:hypothetical protein n=1 Tax=Kitasatospora griseola TaxID=2064 RepID=UPI00342FF509
MANNLPPKVLQPVITHLQRAAANAAPDRAAALRAYNLQRLTRDRRARLIPLPGRNGVTLADALLAAGVIAIALRGGERRLCRAVGWYLLALNPEPEASHRLRTELEEALDRLTKHLTIAPKPMVVPLAFEEHLNTSAARRSAEVRAAVLEQAVPLGGPERTQADRDIDQYFPGTVDRRSNAIALRDLRTTLDRAFGSPLTDDDLDALASPSKRLSDGAGRLYDAILTFEGYDTDTGREILATDPAHVRALLAAADDGRLRHTVWQFCRPAQPFGGCEHWSQSCAQACDHAAWILCLHLDPAQFRRWELSHMPAEDVVRLGSAYAERLA